RRCPSRKAATKCWRRRAASGLPPTARTSMASTTSVSGSRRSHNMGKRANLVRGLFYGGLGLLVLAIMSGLLDEPAGIGKHIIRNDEGYALALLLAGWIEFVRPRLADSTRRWHVSLITAVVLIALGFLIQVGTPTAVATM